MQGVFCLKYCILFLISLFIMITCGICKFSTDNVDKLFIHSTLSHGLTKDSPFSCDLCYRTIPCWKKFREHVINNHGQDELSTFEPMDTSDNFNDDYFDAESCGQDHDLKKCFLSDDLEDIFVCRPKLVKCPVDEASAAAKREGDGEGSISEPSCVPEYLKEDFATNALKFVSKLYDTPDIARCHVQTVIDHVHSLISSNVASVISEVSKVLDSANVDKSTESFVNLLISSLNSPFNNLGTEYLRFKVLREKGFFIDPETFICGRSNVSGVSEKVTAQFMPLRKTLKCFFELPNVLSSTEQYVAGLLSESESGVISNFVQSDLWKQKLQNFSPDKVVLPLFLFFDDLEIGNVLGSHSGVYKIGAVYVWCPCLPPQFVSVLENYFLAMLFHSDDRKADDPYFETSNNRIVFAKLIKEFNFLHSEGISVTTDAGTKQLYFSLGLILGDNLGLHSILGHVECFSATYFCRFCKVTKARSCSLCHENVQLLRSPETYVADLAINDSSLTGVKEECVWNNVIGFHVASNYIVDWMHDVLEGACKYDLSLILSHLIGEKYFTLEQLNYQIVNFNYGPTVSNKPPPVSYDDFNNYKLKMSANEMLTFVQFLGPMVGYLVPKHDKAWNLFLILKDIIDILCCRNLRFETVDLLENLISLHHQLYVELFGNCLKPKHHFMIHYARIIRMCGPLIHLWSMRGESKHRISKRIANVVFSRINILLSIAIKHQLSFAFRLLSQKGFEERLLFSKRCYELNVTQMIGFLSSCNLPSEFHHKCMSLSWVSLNGVKFKHGTCIVIGVSDIGTPTFGLVDSILVSSSRNVCFVIKSLVTLYKDLHKSCYIVEKSSGICCVNLSALLSPFPVIFCTIGNGESVVISKHLL